MPDFSHKQTMKELGINLKDLPSDLQTKVNLFNRRSAPVKDPAKIADFEDESDRLASEIVDWHDSHLEEEELEEEELETPPTPPTPKPTPTPTPAPTPAPEPEPTPTPPTPEPEPKKDDSWGLGFLSDY